MGNDEIAKRASEMIAMTRGKPLSIEERKKMAVELAALMLNVAHYHMTSKEKKKLDEIAALVNDPIGKVFTTRLCDECFRSDDNKRVADQISFTIKRYGIPSFLPLLNRIQLKFFQLTSRLFYWFLTPMVKNVLRKETGSVIIPGEKELLKNHIRMRKSEGVRINLNHLGEAILGEEEAEKRLQIYLEDLAKPEIEYISVKISTIYSQINLLAWEDTLQGVAERLRKLYRAASKAERQLPDGTTGQKFINLDMEEYRDLHLTVELFKRILSEPEFKSVSAGIVLQSYLPDSFEVQRELTDWAMKRVEDGGAPIKVRIVKGANLAMEKVEASIEGWPQAPYTKKSDVDANYKKMIEYGMEPQHAKAVNLGIASHNLFDIAYGLILRSEKGVEKEVCFEMLEGMADHLRRVVQRLSGDILLYCPTATEKEFVNAVAYLVRRLDENTAPENFLRHSFDLAPGTSQWENQVGLFEKSFDRIDRLVQRPRRQQNRNAPFKKSCTHNGPFDNEPNTDWSLPENRLWAESLVAGVKSRDVESVPLVIGGQEIFREGFTAEGFDPSRPDVVPYRYTLADEELADKAIETAVEAAEEWSKTSIEERSTLIKVVAEKLRENHGRLIQAMMIDGGKTIPQADAEVTEAIDFAEYYRRNLEELHYLDDIEWTSKGVVMVTPPWNFPCAIPFGGIAAALLGGNAVIFKPAPESVLVAWEVAKLCWEAGVGMKTLQFIVCDDETVGSRLIKDPRINTIILTGATATAKLFLKLRPGLDLSAETGGKNAMIVSSLSDRDLAIKDIIDSAFGHAGQKCSACSLAILEKEVYDDEHFMNQLRDAAKSLPVGSALELKTKVNPLINPARNLLLNGLTKLEKGEQWLLEPKQDPDNPRLWSPGIKMGVKQGSQTYCNELFGPVLALMRAENLDHAIDIANGTGYGLTSGIHSLDIREQRYWVSRIVAGNLYINRGITGAIVRRQPFGGCKASSFGRGMKAGGPNYLMGMMHHYQKELPKEREPVNARVAKLCKRLEKMEFSDEERAIWNASICSYAFYWNHYFSQDHDPSQIVGQDNILRYVPRKDIVLRWQPEDQTLDALRVIAVALTCHATIKVSIEEETLNKLKKIIDLEKIDDVSIISEPLTGFIDRIDSGAISRVRLLSEPKAELEKALADNAVNIIKSPVMANGRVEMLNHLREVSISHNYHRYGNLGRRENEQRKPLPPSPVDNVKEGCDGCIKPCCERD